MKQTPYGDRIRYESINRFGGLVNPDRASGGEIVGMENLTSEHYPSLSSRSRRKLLGSIKHCTAYGFFDGKPYYVSGTGLYYDGKKVATVTSGNKKILQFPGRLVILPDKLMLKIEEEYYRLSLYAGNVYAYKVTGGYDGETAIDITASKEEPQGGGDILTYIDIAEEDKIRLKIWDESIGKWTVAKSGDVYALYKSREAKAIKFEETYTWTPPSSDSNKRITISTSSEENEDSVLELNFIASDGKTSGGPYKEFETGDYIRIVGYDHAKDLPALANGGVITKIGNGYMKLRVSETLNGTYSYHDSQKLYFYRTYPDFDGAFELDNRLWAWKGTTIYASALGEPDKVSEYNLASTSPWTVDTAGEKICAGIAFDGYPIFFKKNSIIKVYGSTPSEFSIRELECAGAGVDTTSRDSISVCGGQLFYNSPRGIMKYSGGYPSYVGDSIAHLLKSGGLGASDGRRYYLSFPGEETFVYDTLLGLWHREGNGHSHFFTLGASLLGIKGDNIELISGEVPDELEVTGEEDLITSDAELAYITEGALFRKTYNRIRARLQVFTGKLEILASYDDSEPEVIMSVKADKSPYREVRCVDLLVRRCDTLKLYVRGTGDYRIYSIDREFTVDNDEI